MANVTQQKFFEMTDSITDWARERMRRDGCVSVLAVADWMNQNGAPSTDDHEDMIDYLVDERGWDLDGIYLVGEEDDDDDGVEEGEDEDAAELAYGDDE